jgi:chemotaxis protein MotB
MLCATRSRWMTLAFALFCGCATAPAPAPKPAPLGPPEVETVNRVDHDVKRIAEIAQLDRQNQEKKEKIATLEERVAELQQKLESSLHAPSVAAASADSIVSSDASGRVKVQLASDLLFTSGSARISRAGRRALAQIASVLQKTPGQHIEVNGHTDSLPSGKRYEDNWQLSAERARRVIAFLCEQGVDGHHMVVAGYADTQPLDTADSEESRQKNRRVEIFIHPSANDDGRSSSSVERAAPSSAQ